MFIIDEEICGMCATVEVVCHANHNFEPVWNSRNANIALADLVSAVEDFKYLLLNPPLGSTQKVVNEAHLVVSRLSFEANLAEGCSRNQTNKGTGASEMLKVDFECPLQEGSRNEVSGSDMSGTEGRGEEVMQEVVLKTPSNGEGYNHIQLMLVIGNPGKEIEMLVLL